MKTELVITFKDSLMGVPSGLRYKIFANDNEIADSVVPLIDASLHYKFENKKGLIEVYLNSEKKGEILQSSQYNIKVVVLDSSGNSKKVIGEEVLPEGKRITIVVISPWTKIPLGSVGDKPITGDFFDIEYNVRNKNNEVREVYLTIKDIPRKIVLTALKYRGSTIWAGKETVTSKHPLLNESVTFKQGTNKCNVFVNDILTEAGINVAWIEHGHSKKIPIYKNLSPPTAGEWANSSLLLNKWAVEGTPMPGDIGAYSFNYSDASGHVGIIVTDGVTISAGWDRIEVNDAGFRQKNKTGTTHDHDFTIFRRYKGTIK